MCLRCRTTGKVKKNCPVPRCDAYFRFEHTKEDCEKTYASNLASKHKEGSLPEKVTAPAAKAGESMGGATTVVEAEEKTIEATNDVTYSEEPETTSEEADAKVVKQDVQDETPMNASGVGTARRPLERPQKKKC